MSKTNCINCGAAKEVAEIKCPFCGTVYLDMTTIDFYGHTPVILKFFNRNKRATVVKAIPTMGSVTVTPNIVDVSGLDGRRTFLHSETPNIDIDIGFRGIQVIHEEVVRIEQQIQWEQV